MFDTLFYMSYFMPGRLGAAVDHVGPAAVFSCLRCRRSPSQGSRCRLIASHTGGVLGPFAWWQAKIRGYKYIGRCRSASPRGNF